MMFTEESGEEFKLLRAKRSPNKPKLCVAVQQELVVCWYQADNGPDHTERLLVRSRNTERRLTG